MSSPGAGSAASRREPRTVYVAWLAARVLVACIVTVAAITVQASAGGDVVTTPRALTTIGLVALLTSLALGIAMVAGRDIEWSTPYIVALDTFLVGGVVYVTGGAVSPLAALLGANVLVSALTIGPRAPYPVAVASVTLYGAVSVGLANGMLPVPRDQSTALYLLDAPELGVSLASTSIGILLVSLLAYTLANRLFAADDALVSAKREADALAQRNADIIRSISSGLMTTTLDGVIETANDAALEMLGERLEVLVGQRVSRFLPMPSFDPSSREPQRGTGTATRANGQTFPVGLTVTPLLVSSAAPQGVLVSFLDLTEITRLEEAARSAEQLAALGRIAAGLAHEIRNPLSSISGSVELVRESPSLVPEETRLLGIVLAEAERLDDLVRTMLDFAKPKRPRPSLSEIPSIVREIAHMAELGVAGKAGVNVLVEATPGVAADVDPDQLRQVLWNLIKNAIQASSDGQRVWVCVIDAGDDVVVEVRDEGKGLEDEDEEKLFDMFHTGRTHGMGIGLALVKRIVEAHNGRISAHNLAPRGACFRVVFPKETTLSFRPSLESIP